MSEIVQMPVRARRVLEQYKDCIVRTLTTVSWSALARFRSDDEAIASARDEAKRQMISTAIYTVGKDHTEINVRQDMEGLHITMQSIFMTQAKFEEMITAVYTQGVLEGRKSAPL